jgi:hypothetical protein
MLARIIQNLNKTLLRGSLIGELILKWVSAAQGISMCTEGGSRSYIECSAICLQISGCHILEKDLSSLCRMQPFQLPRMSIKLTAKCHSHWGRG